MVNSIFENSQIYGHKMIMDERGRPSEASHRPGWILRGFWDHWQLKGRKINPRILCLKF